MKNEKHIRDRFTNEQPKIIQTRQLKPKKI